MRRQPHGNPVLTRRSEQDWILGRRDHPMRRHLTGDSVPAHRSPATCSSASQRWTDTRLGSNSSSRPVDRRPLSGEVNRLRLAGGSVRLQFVYFNHLGLPVRDERRSGQFYSAYFGFDPATAQQYPDGTVIIRDQDGFDLALQPVEHIEPRPEPKQRERSRLTTSGVSTSLVDHGRWNATLNALTTGNAGRLGSCGGPCLSGGGLLRMSW
jgi:hypothetical protein